MKKFFKLTLDVLLLSMLIFNKPSHAIPSIDMSISCNFKSDFFVPWDDRTPPDHGKK